MIGYLQNITKGAEFTLAFGTQKADETTGAVAIVKISKDGGDFVTCTNSATVITAAGDVFGTLAYQIVLTADEMNADRIVVVAEKTTSAYAITWAIIYTGSSGGGATAQEVWEYATRTLSSSGGISMDDVIQNKANLPSGNLTVRQVFELIAKRLERNKNVPRL